MIEDDDFLSKVSEFERQIANLINVFGVDNQLMVPDYVLARFVCNSLLALKTFQHMEARHRSPIETKIGA